MPHDRVGLHPPRLAEDAGSLLPGAPKPAVVFVVRIAPDGSVTLDGVERAMIRNRAKLAYSTVSPGDLPPAFPELARRFEIGERNRGADRIQMPEQEVVRRDDGGFDLRFRPRNDAENQNAAMSLATNMAVADALHAAGTGLFRTMPAVDERRVGRLRHTARAFGLEWPKAQALSDFEQSLPAGDPKTSAFQLAVRRASGGAAYEPFDPNVKPWHAAVAATYSHVTAPLRRLADRYVIDAALAVANGDRVSAETEQAFIDLPQAMRQGDSRANRVDRAAIDLAEAVVLHGREGEVFEAVVTDEDDRGARIQVRDPAIVTRVAARPPRRPRRRHQGEVGQRRPRRAPRRLRTRRLKLPSLALPFPFLIFPFAWGFLRTVPRKFAHKRLGAGWKWDQAGEKRLTVPVLLTANRSPSPPTAMAVRLASSARSTTIGAPGSDVGSYPQIRPEQKSP